MDYDEFKTRLFSFAEEGYQEFAKAGTPTEYPFLGVRLPILRRFAVEIVKSGEAEEFLKHAPGSFEEITTMTIVIASLPYDEAKPYVRDFLSSGQLPKWTQNKAISKIRDSYRVPKDVKEAVLSLRK